MSTNSDDSDRPSRRSFTKFAAAALVTAPFTLSEVSGQPGAASQDRCAQARRISHGVCPSLDDPHVPHEPPIGIYGGSLTMECENPMYRKGSVNNGPRKHAYHFRNDYYGTMSRLEVITEYEKLFHYQCYPLGSMNEPKLKIWLQKLHHNCWDPDDIDPSKTDAHILLTYGYSRVDKSFKTAVVETDKRFGPIKKGFKLEPTFKHPHMGYFGNPHFRIGRWQLLRDDGSVAYQGYVGQQPAPNSQTEVQVLGFELIPRFNHLERLLQCLGALPTD